MFKLLSICITSLLLIPTYSQSVSLKLFVEDAIGLKDTIVFGINDTATLGIDTSFNEFNIFGTPFDSLDIRVIQRDSANFNCIRETPFYSSPPSPNLYFPNNIDSKIDLRPFGSFESVYNNFEFFIYATNYPVTVRADFSEIQFHFLEGWSSIHLLNNNCDAIDYKPIYYDPINDSLFILTDSSFNTLVANFQHEVGIDEKNPLNDKTIYPNPAQTQFAIIGITENNSITIIDMMGRTIYQTISSINPTQIDITNWVEGLYIVKVKGNITTTNLKVIKQ